MEMLTAHIQTCATLFSRKGYNLKFWQGAGNPLLLTELLQAMTHGEQQTITRYATFTLSTYVYHLNWQSSYTTCDFGIFFSPEKGFAITDIRVSHCSFDHSLLATFYKKLSGNESLPSRIDLNKWVDWFLVNKRPGWIASLLRK